MNRYFPFIFTGFSFQCKYFSSQSLSSNYNIHSFFELKRTVSFSPLSFMFLFITKKYQNSKIVFSVIFVDTLCIHEEFSSNIDNIKFFKIEKSIIIDQCTLLIFDYK